MDPRTFAEWREHGRPTAAFFESWTRREAIGKVVGRGLTKEILTAPLGSAFRTADAVIHHYHIRTRADLHLAIAAVAPQRLLRLRHLTSDLEPDSEEIHVLHDLRDPTLTYGLSSYSGLELGYTRSHHPYKEGNEIRNPTMPLMEHNNLLVQYEQALTRIVDISKETKGQVSGSARLMATLAAKALSFRNTSEPIGDAPHLSQAPTQALWSPRPLGGAPAPEGCAGSYSGQP
jgi:hypothetical protein